LILLAIWLILTRLLPLLNIRVSTTVTTVLAVLAIAAGLLILLRRWRGGDRSKFRTQRQYASQSCRPGHFNFRSLPQGEQTRFGTILWAIRISLYASFLRIWTS